MRSPLGPVAAIAVVVLTASCLSSRSGSLYRPEGPIAYRHSTISRTPERVRSIEMLEARIANHPSPALELGELASAYVEQAKLSGDPTWLRRAEDAARRSLRILPTPNAAKAVLAAVAEAEHRFAEAIRIGEEALADRSAADSASVILVTSYLAAGDVDSAAAHAERILRRRPEAGAYLLHALTNEARGRDAEAAFDYARAVALEDGGQPEFSARARALWARFLGKRGDYRNADTLLDESLRIVPDYALALGIRGELSLRRGDAKRAAEALDKAFRVSRQVRHLILYARAKAALGDARVAAEIREQADTILTRELASGSTGHRLDRVMLLLDRNGSGDAAAALKLAREELATRRSAETYVAVARAALASQEMAVAAQAIQSALASGTRDPETFALAARIELGLRNAPRASLYAELAAGADPNGAEWKTLRDDVAAMTTAPARASWP